MTLILFLLIFGVVVVAHEFGHFIMAKKAGVYVYEISIGMGPKVWSKQGKETEYSLRAIPIGGFCAMAGEDLDDDEFDDDLFDDDDDNDDEQWQWRWSWRWSWRWQWQ